MAKVGDTVRYLNAVGGGKITRIDGALAYVDEDGFETPVLLRECVVVASADSQPKPASKGVPTVVEMGQPSAPAPRPVAEEEIVLPAPETPRGEKLNVVLAFAATSLKALSSSDYDAFLVNDSNYYLYFSFLTRGESQDSWTARYAGVVEPGIQVELCQVLRDELSGISRIAVQYIAFKKGKEFALKTPISVEYKFDATKFFRLHCFRPNQYFDEPVIAYDIVKDDTAAKPLEISQADIDRAMREKHRVDAPAKPSAPKRRPKDEPLVVDLHIHELVDTTAGLSNADMLNLQVDKFREIMDANLRRHGQKIVFIHGKGEGVLRQALLKELSHRYKGHDVQDASFREYGFGATQVTIK